MGSELGVGFPFFIHKMPKRGREYKSGRGKSSKKKQRTDVTFGSKKMFVQRSFGNPLALFETKYFDAYRTSNAIDTADTDWTNAENDPATLNCLFAPVQGDDFNNRQARQVSVFKIMIRGAITAPAEANQGAANDFSRCRVVIYMDKQSNGTQSQGEDVLAAGASTGDALDMFQNPANFGRFKVLKDKLFNISDTNMTYDGTNVEVNGTVRSFKWIFKFRKPIIVHYNATNGGTIADVVDNSFHLIVKQQGGSVTPSIRYRVRTYFKDK